MKIKKIFKEKIVRYIGVFFTYAAVAQTPISNNLIQIGTTSPEVASMGKFGNIPVSYTTGVPQISIPVYTIKINDIVLPISLDYHASGIRVDELSSSVGTGWALDAGGMVSRSMIGYPDELADGYLSSPPFDQLMSSPTSYTQFIYDNTKGLNDISPDVFSFSIGGQSGKFIIKKSDHSFIQFPLSNNKIETYNSVNYKITDAHGIAYIFEPTEQTSYGFVNGVNLIPRYVSAWRISKIISSNIKDTVFFSYESGSGSMHNKTYSHTIGTMPSCSSPGASPGGQLIDDNNYTSQLVQVTELYPTEIRWRGGKVVFTNIDGRQDRASAKRLDAVNIYASLNGGYTLIKSAKLNFSYFYYLPNNYQVPQDVGNESLYRLKLDSVQFFDASGANTPQVYKMTYDNTPMAPRESCGQDFWGFNNGQFSNPSMMPVQTVYFDPNQLGQKTVYRFGDANRDCNPQYLKACTIQSITYPTGGKTLFNFEPHQFKTNVNRTVTQDIGCLADGSVRTTTTSSPFTVTTDMQNLRYNIYISAYNVSPPPSNRPMVLITDQASGQVVFSYTSMTPNSAYSSGPLTFQTGVLQVGHTYTMTANTYVLNANVKSQIDILYDHDTVDQLTIQGGGLRVSSIIDYDKDGSFISRKAYQYNADGNGTLLTPYQYFATTSKHTTFRIGCQGTGPSDMPSASCMYATGKPSVIYYANSVVPISQFAGSPVLYGGITEYETNADGSAVNGKKVYGYQVYQDQQLLASTDLTITGPQLISNSWRNGYLQGEDVYKSQNNAYKLVESHWHVYNNYFLNEERGIKISPRYSQQITTTSCETFNSNSLGNDVILDSFMTPYNAILLQSDTTRTYDDTGNSVVAVSSYNYNDQTHLLPTSKQTIDSKQIAINETMQYPHDFAASGNVYQTMVDRNIIAPVIQSTVQKNNNIVNINKVNYTDWFNNGNLLLPSSVQVQTGSNALETRVNFNAYDLTGNIQQQSLTGGAPTTYLWSYNNQYPVVEVKNADLASVNNALISLSMSAASIGTMSTITPAQLLQIRTAIQTALPNAQVTTYTYQPLVGMTSATDAKGMTTYYEYDSFQRLMNVKDKDGNILKHTDYHYQNQ